MSDAPTNQPTNEPTGAPANDRRTIDLSVDVVGTPDEVWRAVATGPGITSWYVATRIEERAGGALTSEFGPAEEMHVHGLVDVWEPPRRVAFSGGESAGGGLAFEWIVEAKGDGLCTVRLINSGFGEGGPWDEQYDAMTEGWLLFMSNLQLHLEHFGGRDGHPMLPMAMWPEAPAAAWPKLTAALGIPVEPAVGERVEATADGVGFAGKVASCTPGKRLALILDHPAPGTAFLATEDAGGMSGVSVWQYLYGDDAPAIIERDLPAWGEWLAAQAGPPPA
ncbi:MAG: SRPBCC domain-containing protein [Nocardioides sp.]